MSRRAGFLASISGFLCSNVSGFGGSRSAIQGLPSRTFFHQHLPTPLTRQVPSRCRGRDMCRRMTPSYSDLVEAGVCYRAERWRQGSCGRGWMACSGSGHYAAQIYQQLCHGRGPRQRRSPHRSCGPTWIRTLEAGPRPPGQGSRRVGGGGEIVSACDEASAADISRPPLAADPPSPRPAGEGNRLFGPPRPCIAVLAGGPG